MTPFAVTTVDLARTQFGMTSLYHFLFVPLTLGLAPLVAVMQTIWQRTGVDAWLLRFLDPERGRVTLGGRDLRELRQEDVRRAIAVAGQGAHLFSASIRENVLLGRPGASDEDVERALRRARIWDWVGTLPAGWHTQVGEDGRELSGGQRQRVALARALLADAPVLVLDEPTAHLDPDTARALIGDVVGAAAGRSLLLITHRPEGLELVDEVVRLG